MESQDIMNRNQSSTNNAQQNTNDNQQNTNNSQRNTNQHQYETNESQRTINALVDRKYLEMEREVMELRALVKVLIEERSSAMKYGLVVLGSTVFGLASWIVTYILGHR